MNRVENRKPPQGLLMKPVRVFKQDVYDVDEISARIREFLEADGVKLKGARALALFCDDSAGGGDADAKGVRPEVVIAAAEAMAALGAEKIAVAGVAHPGCASRSSRFSAEQTARLRAAAEIEDIRSMSRARANPDNPLTQMEFRLPKILLESDFVLSLPKAKTSLTTTVCSSMDLTHQTMRDPDRLALHDFRLHQKLVDIHACRAPDYAVYDAIVAGEGQGPMNPSPRKLGLLVGGSNPANVDVAMANLMGYGIHDVAHLRLLADRGECASSAATMDVRPEGAIGRSARFRDAEWDIEGACPWISVTGGAEKYCPGGCVGFIRQAMDALVGASALNGTPAHIIAGRPVGHPDTVVDRQRTLVVGDCSQALANIGVFIPGCPPDISAIEFEMMKIFGTKGANGLKTRMAVKAGMTLDAVVDALRRGVFDGSGPGGVSASEIAISAVKRVLDQ